MEWSRKNRDADVHKRIADLLDKQLSDLKESLYKSHVGDTIPLFSDFFWHGAAKCPIKFIPAGVIVHKLRQQNDKYGKLDLEHIESRISVRYYEIESGWEKAGLIIARANLQELGVKYGTNFDSRYLILTERGRDIIHTLHPKKSSWLLIWEEFLLNKIVYTFGILGGIVTLVTIAIWLNSLANSLGSSSWRR